MFDFLKLKDAFDAVDLEQSLDWSGKFYGIPAILDYIIETQAYQVKPEEVLPINGGTNMGIFLTCMALLKSFPRVRRGRRWGVCATGWASK